MCILHCLAKKVCHFDLNQHIVVLWSGVASVGQVEAQQVSWVPECTEWPGYPINGLFIHWWLGHIPGCQCQDSSGSSCERVEHEDTWVSGEHEESFSRMNWPQSWLYPIKSLWDVQEKTEVMVWLFWHKYKSWPKMYATLDGNKYDIA